MDARQDTLANPFGMDEDCQNCPDLCESRTQVVHGYGDVGAEFLVVGEAPGDEADEVGVPFVDTPVLDIVSQLGLCDTSGDEPQPENAFFTLLTRCRHPGRDPTDEEVRNCDPYLASEIRMINPEIIVPVGERVCEALAFEYTTRDPADFDIRADHATPIRGRGFELVPLLPDPTDEEREAFLDQMRALMGRDYRQTKGRRGR